MTISKYNIDSHRDGSEVSAAWVKGMIAAGHTTHVKTAQGTVALRPSGASYHVDFVAAGGNREYLDASSKAEVLRWILAHINPQPKAPTTIGELVKSAKALSARCIKQARVDNSYYYKHRGVELVYLDERGERVGDAEYYDIPASLTIKQIKSDMAQANLTGISSVALQGGVDCYDSWQQSMEEYADYEPMTDVWNTLELAL